MGLSVTVVEALAQPLERVFPPEIGRVLADVHRSHGVDVRLGIGVGGVLGDDRVRGLELADGSTVDAEVVVVGIGVAPTVEWLGGSGVPVGNGVICDATLRAAPGIVAAGDVAEFHNDLFGERMRVEHWDTALAAGAAAARSLLAEARGDRPEPFRPVPWFWSDQYDRKIQLAGRAAPDDDFEVVHGSLEERRFLGLYGRAGRLVGALGWNRPRHVMQFRMKLTEGISWDEAVAFGREMT
jgi:3-phenylpropionate/trans-cinnamate dioxygenase ferredoxin reductase subunit